MSRLCFFAVSIIALLPVAVHAQDFQPAQGKVTASVLNVRNIASTGGTVLGSVKRGDLVQVLERSKAKSKVEEFEDYWYRIQLPKNQTGWIFGSHVTFEVNLESGLRWKTVRPAGRMIAIVAMPKGEIFAGTDGAEIFVTADKGKSFRKIIPQALGTSINRIDRMAENNGALWIASGEKGGLWVTRDSGGSWAQFTTAQGLPSDDIFDIKFDGDRIWVACGKGGVAMSEDQGTTWKTIGPSAFPGGLALAVLPLKDKVIVGAEKGLYSIEQKSGFFGKSESWVRLGEKSRVDNGILALALGSDSKLFAGTEKGLAVSPKGDPNQWTALGGAAKCPVVISEQKKRVLVGTDGGGLNISLDGGSTWVTYKREHGLGGNRVWGVAVSPDNTIWVTSEGGLSYHE